MKGFDITNYTKRFHNDKPSLRDDCRTKKEDTRVQEFLCNGGKIEKIPMGMSGIAHRTLRQQNEHAYKIAKKRKKEKKQ
jgi:hypothetical protein